MVEIAFSGKMSAGKTTIVDLLCEKLGGKYKRKAIGDQIKLVSKIILDDPKKLNNIMGQLENFDNYLEDAEELHKKYKNEKFEYDSEGNFIKNKVYRPYVQEVGKIARKHFGEGVWVDIYLDSIKKDGIIYICDDVRTEYEYNKMKELEVFFVRLNVEEEKQKKRIINLYGNYDEKTLTDVSETALDNKVFDLVLDTTYDSIEETLEKVLSAINNKTKTQDI